MWAVRSTRATRWLLTLSLATAAILLGACSPEHNRLRGDHGADTGNRPAAADVDVHGKVNPNFDVPERGQAIREIRGQ